MYQLTVLHLWWVVVTVPPWRATTEKKTLWRLVSLCGHIYIIMLIDVFIQLLSTQWMFKSWMLWYWSAQFVPCNHCPKVDFIRTRQIPNLVKECVSSAQTNVFWFGLDKCQLLTRITLSLPLLSWTEERKYDKRLQGRDKERERSLTNYCHGQTDWTWGEKGV